MGIFFCCPRDLPPTQSCYSFMVIDAYCLPYSAATSRPAKAAAAANDAPTPAPSFHSSVTGKRPLYLQKQYLQIGLQITITI